MKISKYICCVDLGTSKTVVMIGHLNEHGKLEIIAYGKSASSGVKRGMVSNISNTVKSINEALALAKQHTNLPIEYVIVGIAGKHIRSLQQKGQKIRKNAGEPIEYKEVKELIEDMFNLSTTPGEDIFDVLPQEFIIDGEDGITEPVGMLGSSLEGKFHIILGQTTAARNIITCVTKCNLKPQNLILESIASASAVLSEEEKEAGVVLIDIGCGSTDIAIFKDGIIRHTAVIPEGGEMITQDIQEGCSLVRSNAEPVKLQFGSAVENENDPYTNISIPSIGNQPPREISLRSLAGIIQASCESILLKVMIEIQNSGYTAHQLIGGIVLTGGGSQLKHLVQLTNYITGMHTRIGLPEEHLANNTPDNLRNPCYSTSIGLILEGFKKIEQDETEITHTDNETNENVNEIDKEETNNIPLEDQSMEEVQETAKRKGLNIFTGLFKRGSFFDTFFTDIDEDED